MDVTTTPIPGLLVVEPRVFRDARGRVFEAWNARRYAEAGIRAEFVQDNVSHSTRGVVRGLHYQSPNPQGKLVQVLDGAVWDVAVDLRAGSPTFGRWFGVDLDAESARQFWLPAGFAHGFAVTSERAVVAYKCAGYYDAASERTLLWNDPALGISWPIADPILSEKDRNGLPLDQTEAVHVPAAS